MHTLIRTARTTGLFYLALAVVGGLGFLVVRPRLFADGDPAGTLANLVTHEGIARAGVALELLIVLTQALAAAWFYRLFRRVDPLNALGVAAFGLVNSVVILSSAGLLGAAVELAQDPVGDTAATVQVLHLVSANLWGAGAIFFGLWLIPMGPVRAQLRLAAPPARLGAGRRWRRLSGRRVPALPGAGCQHARRPGYRPGVGGRVLDDRLPADPWGAPLRG